MTWICPRSNKRLKRPQNEGSRTKRVKEYNPRRLFFSDRMNVGQASTWGNLGDLSGISNDKDELETCTKRIRVQKYIREKLLPPH